jgi:hypothetical protein
LQEIEVGKPYEMCRIFCLMGFAILLNGLYATLVDENELLPQLIDVEGNCRSAELTF